MTLDSTEPGAIAPRRMAVALTPGDGGVVVTAVVTCLGVWSGEPAVAVIGAVVGLVVACSARALLIGVAIAVLVPTAVLRSNQAWAALAPDELGPHRGWVRLVDDPQPYASSTRVIVEADGQRFELWSRGRAQQLRVRRWRGGEWVYTSGERVALDAQRAHRVAWQHVVGEYRLDWVGDSDPGGPVARASNRVRAAIERAAEVLPDDDGALYRGLVVGDDRDQPPAMIARFRASGLSHLTAVSGQNVAFVLAACGPFLRRLRPVARWVVSVALIGWFMALTRFEPSIVRAGAMAALSASAYLTGRERSPLRLLALAVTGLVLVDPLLLWSVGFWLSVGATAGVVTVGPWLAGHLAWSGGLALPLGITLGAQVGVVVPSVLVFGRLPLVSVPANLLAVPVAGAVMLYGLPAGLLAGAVPQVAPIVMLPVRFGTRWVDSVAMLGAALEPPGAWPWVGWALLAFAASVGGSIAFVRGRRTGKNRSPHGDASADR